jgi:hypothetical protein
MITNLFIIANLMIIVGSVLVLISCRDKTKYISREHQDFMRFYRTMKAIQDKDNKTIKRKGNK